jgi:hypothetical protein
VALFLTTVQTKRNNIEAVQTTQSTINTSTHIKPLIIVSDPLGIGKAAHIFSHSTVSSPLPLVVSLAYYSIQGPDFY